MTDLMDREEVSSGACSLDSTIAPDVIKNKDSAIYIQILENFNNKIAIQEEIMNLEVMNNKFG